MPINSDKLLEWIEEIRKELNELNIRHERLETRVETRNKILWALITLIVAASGIIIGLITHLKNISP